MEGGMTDLFPETESATAAQGIEWQGSQLDKYGGPRVTVRLIDLWHQHRGYQVGWFAMCDKALDEWHPQNADQWKRIANYPWHRPDELPCSNRHAIACGIAARAVKIVLEQMKQHVEPDLVGDIQAVQDRIERQAIAWLRGEA